MREAQLTLARTRVTQFEWTLGDSLRLVKIPIVEDNRSRASAATAQILGLPENIFRQPFLLPRWGQVRCSGAAPREAGCPYMGRPAGHGSEEDERLRG